MGNKVFVKDGIQIKVEDFKEYLLIQRDGQYNPFSPQARELAGVEKDVWLAIIKNFNELYDFYGSLEQIHRQEMN